MGLKFKPWPSLAAWIVIGAYLTIGVVLTSTNARDSGVFRCLRIPQPRDNCGYDETLAQVSIFWISALALPMGYMLDYLVLPAFVVAIVVAPIVGVACVIFLSFEYK